MTLTPQMIDQLNAPFAEPAYGVVNGKVYLRKSAIKDRLSDVDPGWALSEPQFVAREGDVVFMSATLTVGGVSRGALGSGLILSTKSDGRPIEGINLAREVSKAYKAAASDCLSRAAVYFLKAADDLREKPNDAGSTATISAYLKRQQPSTPQSSSGTQPPARRAASEDLRDKDVAARFIQRWRGQALSDTDVLAALGVAQLSEWTKGRAAADDAVNAWLAAKLAQESA